MLLGYAANLLELFEYLIPALRSLLSLTFKKWRQGD